MVYSITLVLTDTALPSLCPHPLPTPTRPVHGATGSVTRSLAHHLLAASTIRDGSPMQPSVPLRTCRLEDQAMR